MRPGWAVLGYTPRGRKPTPITVWEEFSADVRAAAEQGLRVCVSTEDFGSAGPPRIQRIVEDLGGERVHVVAVLRRLDRLLPSQWQERVKSHDTITFDAWLRRVLGDDVEDREHKRFWASHDMVAMADRWVPFVGDRFTLLAADESDPDVVPRAFEQLLGLPTGLLALPPASNASLSNNATELLRRINELFVHEGWSDTTYNRMIQQGVVKQLGAAGRPAGEEPIPPLPGWAAARAAELSDQRAEALRERGVRVVGELARLQVPAPRDSSAPARAETVSVESGVRTLAGLVESLIAETGRSAPVRRRRRRPVDGRAVDGRAVDGPALEELGGRELVRLLADRARAGARRSR